MKNLLFIALLLVGCGKQTTTYVTESIETKEVFVKQDFERVWYLNNNSLLEILQNADDKVTFLSVNQSLQSINPKNSTFAHHPKITDANVSIVNGKVFLSKNVNYNSGHDLEEDVSGANITGQRRTDYTFEIKDNGKLKLTIEVYSNKISNNANYIVAKRVFIGE